MSCPFDWTELASGFDRRFDSSIFTVDSHTAGEPTRLIVGGIESLPGSTMAEKRRYFIDHHDSVRLLLTTEPRGHRDMFCACVTDPVTPGASFGLIYMDARRYPYLCGHATIGAVTTLIELGPIQDAGPEQKMVVDTPSGPMPVTARVEAGRVASVSIRTVPSFVQATDVPLQVPGLGMIEVDTVCVGGFFVMVAADRIGLDIRPENGARLTALGMEIIRAANDQLQVRHPERAEVATVDVVEFYDPSGDRTGVGKSAVIYGEAHLDRSPCGTGTAAKLTLLHHRGLLAVGELFINTGPLGTEFQATIAEQTTVGSSAAVVVEIRGQAHLTGMNRFVLDDSDSFPRGFLL